MEEHAEGMLMLALEADVQAALIAAVATVTAVLLPLLASLRRARSENRSQHAEVAAELGRLGGKVDVIGEDVRHIGTRLDGHLDDHARHTKEHP